MRLVLSLFLASFALLSSDISAARSCSIHCADGTSCAADDGVTHAKSARHVARDALTHRDEIARRWPEASADLADIDLALTRKDEALLADSLHRLLDKVPARRLRQVTDPPALDKRPDDAAFVSCTCAQPSAGRVSQADCSAT